MKILPAIFLLFMALTAKAQTLKGTINDDKRQPVPGAAIRLTNAADTLSAVSDEQGKFSITLRKTGIYNLQITSIGFSELIISKLVILKDTNLYVLTLKNETKSLAGVTINGNLPQVERQLDKTVVNVAQNISNDGATVLELMQRLPGVQMTTEGQVLMSGRAGVNVLIDGKPTYLSAPDLAALLGEMPASEIQRIEIMSNPGSKYDAAGTGGIINIVKKRNKKAGLNGNVSVAAAQGYYGRYNGGFTLNYKTEHYNLLLSDSHTYNKTFSKRTVASDVINADNSLVTEQASVTDGINTGTTNRPSFGMDFYLTKKTTVSFSGTAGFGSSNNALFSQMDLLDSARRKTGHIDFNSTLKDSPFNYTIGLQLSHQLDTAGKNLTIDADHSEYRNYPTQTNRNATDDAQNIFVSNADALLLQYRQLDIYSAKADYVQPLKNIGSFEAGIKSSYVKANNDNSYYDQSGRQNVIDLTQSNYSVNSENINAAYINLDKSYKNLTWQAGLRAEQTITKGKQLLTGESVNQDYLQLFPTLFTSYKANYQNTFTLRFGRRIERAAYNELVPFRRPQTATLYFEGNPDLSPYISYHAELAWAYGDAFFIILGYDPGKDYIQTFPYLDSNKVTITRRPTNVQHAYSWNIDVSYSKKLTDWWSTENTVSLYQNGFSGEAAGYSLNNSGIPSLYLSANNTFLVTSRLSAEADLEYNSKRQLINSTFGAYTVLNIGVKRMLFDKKASISLNARNILDSENHNAIDRNKGLYQYSYFNFYTRAITLTFSYRFGSGQNTKVRMNSGSADEQKRAGN